MPTTLTHTRHTIANHFKFNARDMKRKEYSVKETNCATYGDVKLLKSAGTFDELTKGVTDNSNFVCIVVLHCFLYSSENILCSPIKDLE